MNPILCRAIDEHKLVRFAYRGGNRVVEPYCHGVTKGGHELLRGYQTIGYSSRGRGEGWRLFRLDEMANLALIDEPFRGKRSGRRRLDDTMATIFRRL